MIVTTFPFLPKNIPSTEAPSGVFSKLKRVVPETRITGTRFVPLTMTVLFPRLKQTSFEEILACNAAYSGGSGSFAGIRRPEYLGSEFQIAYDQVHAPIPSSTTTMP